MHHSAVVISNNGPSVPITWDLNRPIPGPHRRVTGLALDDGILTIHGTPLKDSVAVAIDGSNFVLTLNGERFEYLASEIDSVQFVHGKHLSSLSIGNGATVIVAERGTANDPDGVLIVDSLSIASGGVLDLTNNSMIIDYASLGTLVTDVQQYISAGRLVTNSEYAPGTRLGYRRSDGGDATEGSQGMGYTGSFAGVTVDTTCMLIKYTYAGDTNLDGIVNLLDLTNLAINWQGTGMVWAQGDFDYDGDVDSTDLAFISANWQSGVGGPLRPGGGGEPGGGDEDFVSSVEKLGLSEEEMATILELLGSNAASEIL